MKRFNLWEKLILENEELPDDEEMVDDEEVEEEADDTIFDLMVSFIINLPEDVVPDDMRSVYNNLIAEIGDNYLGGDEEFSDEEIMGGDEESFDEPTIKDDEIKTDKKED